MDRDSVRRIHASGCGSGSCYFRHWLSRPQQKPILKENFLCLLLFEGTFTSFFKDKKSKEVTKQYESRFFLLVLLDDRRIWSRIRIHTQGCGSALIWVAGSGSGSRRAKWPIKREKNTEFSWSAACSLFRAEGFFCSLGVLYGGLGISKLQFLIKKLKIKISSCKFFFNFRSSNLNPDPDLDSGSAIRKNARSGSALNQWGSATLSKPLNSGSGSRSSRPINTWIRWIRRIRNPDHNSDEIKNVENILKTTKNIFLTPQQVFNVQLAGTSTMISQAYTVHLFLLC